MTHLTDAQILAVRDGALVDSAVALHATECPECGAALDSARTRADDIRAALSALDEPVDLHGAKAAVRARLAATTPSDRVQPASRYRWSLGKAAAATLIAAGALSALPGSPVRDWIARDDVQATTTAAPTESPASARELVGGRLAVVPDGQITVELTEVPAATRIEVTWTDSLNVTVQAPQGSAFSYGEDVVRAQVSEGPVLVEMPRAASSVSMSVNGRTYLRGSIGALQLDTPADTQDGTLTVFVVRQ